MDYRLLINNWHAKASEEDIFSRFVFEYLAFIAYLKRIKYVTANNDRVAIQLLKHDDTTRDRYLEEIEKESELKLAWETIIAELEITRLGNVSSNSYEVTEIRYWNCSHPNSSSMTAEEKARMKGVIYGLSDWENMVEFIYSIRNNLFHGGKDPQEERDQLLVENGYLALRPLVEILLS